jgi:hypothetical protein
MSRSGSARKGNIAGIPINIKADADISKTPRVTIEGIAHSGGVLAKETLEPGQAEAISAILTPSEYETLEGIRNEGGIVPMSYELADGTVYRTEGRFHLAEYTSQELTCEITMFPVTEWATFAAS